jgi:hypothetical protein
MGGYSSGRVIGKDSTCGVDRGLDSGFEGNGARGKIPRPKITNLRSWVLSWG